MSGQLLDSSADWRADRRICYQVGVSQWMASRIPSMVLLFLPCPFSLLLPWPPWSLCRGHVQVRRLLWVSLCDKFRWCYCKLQPLHPTPVPILICFSPCLCRMPLSSQCPCPPQRMLQHADRQLPLLHVFCCSQPSHHPMDFVRLLRSVYDMPLHCTLTINHSLTINPILGHWTCP